MPRTETLLMDGWSFSMGDDRNGAFRPVSLPHDWAIGAPIRADMDEALAQGFRDRWGVGWYRREINIEKKAAGHVYHLDFDGIYESSTVWVNGHVAGGHGYGYTAFRLEVTDYLRTGKNLVEVRVDNMARPADRWYSGCGIYRTVRLIAAPSHHLDDREVVVRTTLDGDTAVVHIDAGIDAAVQATLTGHGTSQAAQADDGRLSLRVAHPALWSADTPNLYTLSLSLMEGARETDRLPMRIGLREIVMDAWRGMLVNGQAVKLQGVCLHQDVGCRGIAAKKEIWRERLAVLKEMGCNALRPSHHMFSAEFMDLCDEMGFYVYEEAFDKWTGGAYGRHFEQGWQADIDAMVRRDRNRACVFMWGVGNEVENQGQPSMLALLSRLVARVKQLDATRPVGCAMNPHFKREHPTDMAKVRDIQQFVDEVDEQEITDQAERVERIAGIAALVDVICCNYQEQWYPAIHERCPDKLILGTEVYQYFMGHPDQMKNLTESLPILAPVAHDYVIGSMIWSGYDYLGEAMAWPSKGWSGAPLRTNREKKPGFYLLQRHWSAAPMVHFSVMDCALQDECVKAHWDTPPFADHWHFPQLRMAVIPYVIASNCEEVRLWLNGERYYLPAPATCANGLIRGFLPWQAGTVRVEGMIDGAVVCEHALTTPGMAVQLRFDQERLCVPAEAGYEVLLTVRALDDAGSPCFRENARVHFCAEGGAQVLAVDNGCLLHNESYRADSIPLYRGVTSVQLRLPGGPGRYAVSAFADGMRCGSTEIMV